MATKIKATKDKRRISTGRPKLEDQTVWTEEMSQYCWKRRKGMLPEEAAEAINVPTEKAYRYEKNPMVKNRIEFLFGDKKQGWNCLADELYEVSLQTAIKKIKDGEIPHQNLQWYIERLEKRFQVYEEGKKQQPKEEEQKGIFEGEE